MELKFDFYRRHHIGIYNLRIEAIAVRDIWLEFLEWSQMSRCVPRSLCDPKNRGFLWRLRSVWRQRHDYWMMLRTEEGKGSFDQDDDVEDGGYGIVDTGKEWSGRWRNWGCFAGDGVSRGKIGVVPSPIKIHYPCTNVLVSLHLGFLLPPQGLLLTNKRSKVSLI